MILRFFDELAAPVIMALSDREQCRSCDSDAQRGNRSIAKAQESRMKKKLLLVALVSIALYRRVAAPG